ncbi:MAG: zinc ABC transporter substrate-binding protein [Gemmatimonadetes bacterium]|nr:zinc ABC transporter substrate-binding protein [Gemmatimonadota bacterium]
MHRILIGLGAAFLALTPRADAGEPLRVVASTTDVGAIARAVLGRDASVEIVARPDRDPHALEVRPSTMRLTAKADFYLKVGLSLDLWADDIVRGSRNRDLKVVDCSQWVEVLEKPAGKVDLSQGDVHPEGNPHWWTDPLNAAGVARGLADVFGRARPDEADRFRTNAETFAAEAERRTAAWRERAGGARFAEYHRSWVYFAHRFGAEIVARVEPLPGIPPSARQLQETADVLKATGVRAVFRDPYQTPSPVRFLEREVGARDVLIPTSCEEPTPESYFVHLEQAVAALEAR